MADGDPANDSRYEFKFFDHWRSTWGFQTAGTVVGDKEKVSLVLNFVNGQQYRYNKRF